MENSRGKRLVELALLRHNEIILDEELLSNIPIIFENDGDTLHSDFQNNTNITITSETRSENFLYQNRNFEMEKNEAHENTIEDRNNEEPMEYHSEELNNVEEKNNDDDAEDQNEEEKNEFEEMDINDDPDYENDISGELSDSEEELEATTCNELEELEPEYGNVTEGRKRRTNAEKNEWKRNKNAELRMKGQEYLGYSRKNNVIKQNVIRKARQMGSTCNSKICKKTQARKCSLFTESSRKEIFQKFWSELNWDQRKIYVCSHVSRISTKRKTVEEGTSRRSSTLCYSLSHHSEKLPVCRQMFLNTLGIGSFTVQSWVKDSSCGMVPERII